MHIYYTQMDIEENMRNEMKFNMSSVAAKHKMYLTILLLFFTCIIASVHGVTLYLTDMTNYSDIKKIAVTFPIGIYAIAISVMLYYIRKFLKDRMYYSHLANNARRKKELYTEDLKRRMNNNE